MPDGILFDHQNLFLQAQLAAEADTPGQPDFNLMAKRQAHALGQQSDSNLTPGQPLTVALFGAGSAEIELALLNHVVPGCDENRATALTENQEAFAMGKNRSAY